jgi:hypothetical protein
LGARVEVSMDKAEALAALADRRSNFKKTSVTSPDVCSFCGSSGYFTKFGPMDPSLLNRVLQYGSLISMSDAEFEESLAQTRELRQFLLSLKS